MTAPSWSGSDLASSIPWVPQPAAPAATAAAASARRRERPAGGMAAASIRNNPRGHARAARPPPRVTAVHIALGVAVVAVNLVAGLWGGWAWWQGLEAP